MIPSKLWANRLAPTVEPETAPETPAPSSYPGLTAHRFTHLVNAIHERWHGQHTPEGGKTKCAELAGAGDDIAAIAPDISDWILEAEDTGRAILRTAAKQADRFHRIAKTSRRDVDPYDLRWFEDPAQGFFRDIEMGRPVTTHHLARWLRALAESKP